MGLVCAHNLSFPEQIGFLWKNKNNNKENDFLKNIVGYAEFSIT